MDNCTVDRCYAFFLSFLGGSESLNRILHGGYVSEYPFSLYEGRELAHISVEVVQLSVGMMLCRCRAFFSHSTALEVKVCHFILEIGIDGIDCRYGSDVCLLQLFFTDSSHQQ